MRVNPSSKEMPRSYRILLLLSVVTLFSLLFLHDDRSSILGKWLDDPHISCVLPNHDPWDPTIADKLNTDRTRTECVPSGKQLTALSADGVLRVLEEAGSFSCSYRIVYADYFNFERVETSEWFNLTSEPVQLRKNFVETKCSNSSGDEIYNNFHFQVYDESTYRKEEENVYSIMTFVMDSVSASNAARSLVETRKILRTNYDAVTFRYHNKDGVNSNPNAYAMFTGNRIYDLDKKQFPANWQSEIPDRCTRLLRENETIFYGALKMNYSMLMAGEGTETLVYPNCRPYEHIPTPHYSHSLFKHNLTLTEQSTHPETFYFSQCAQPYHRLLEYTTQFLKKFDGTAKFTHIWSTNLAHDSPDSLFKADEDFAEFFRAHEKTLERSFVFFMADHGFRYGEVRETKIGEYEDNNPMLMIAVPKALRKNAQLMANLKTNSALHTSHFDVYATLYDILHLAKKNNYTDFDSVDFRSVIGERRGKRAASLLRPIEKQRTCFEMQIPEEYCLCSASLQPVSAESAIVQRAGHEIIRHINSFLSEFPGIDGKCEILTLARVISAESLSLSFGRQVLRVRLEAEAPSKGVFQASVRVSLFNTLEVISRVVRVNAYGKQGNCAMHENTRPLCYCKNQIVE